MSPLYPVLEINQCKACKADIHWIKMPTGKMMPVDAKPLSVIVFHQQWDNSFIPEVRKAFMPHWATCPFADQFRRGNGLSEK